MARIRTIKPEFFTSADIVSLTPLARLFYVSLWCESDRAGRLKWKPATLKLRYLPGDNVDVNDLAEELINAGLIVLYEVDGVEYAEIPTFETHQVINNREAQSELPSRVKHASGTRTLGAPAERKEGKEGKEPRVASRDSFSRFWDAYPKKRSKGDAEKAWRKINPDDEMAERILRAVEVAMTRDDWRKSEGQFIPYPASWLNAKGWEDGVGQPCVGTGPQTDPLFRGAI